MKDHRELSFSVRLFLKAYPWRRIDPLPWTALPDCRLALFSSAGFVAPGQKPFDESVRGGDYSFRQIPSDTDVRTLTNSHRSQSLDPAGLLQDPNLAFPLDRVRELVQTGRIKSVSSRHLSFMGSITAPGRLIRESAPEAARWLRADSVDVALLAPV